MRVRTLIAACVVLTVSQITGAHHVDAYEYSGSSSATYTEGQAAVAIVPNLTMTTPGMPPGASLGTVSIVGGFVSGDLLSYSPPGCITTSTYNAATGVLSLSGPPGCESPGAPFWQSAFRAVRFSTSADAPDTTRTIRFTTNYETQGSHSVTVTLAAGAPDQPLAPTAIAGDKSATVTVSPALGGLAPRSHIVTASPGGRTCEVSTSAGSCTIDGLTNGESYTFVSRSRRLSAISVASSASSAVTPQAPVAVTAPPATSAVVTAPPATSVVPTTVTTTIADAGSSSPRRLKVGRSITGSSLAGMASLRLERTSVVRLTLSRSSASKCQVKGSRVHGLRTGTCRVKVAVTTRGRTTSRTVVLTIAR